MENGLIKRIGLKALPFIFGGLSLVNSGCSPYDEKIEMGKSTVYYDTKDKIFETTSWDIKEEKGNGTEIKYNLFNSLRTEPSKAHLVEFQIDGENYFITDTTFSEINEKYEERAKYLVNRRLFVKDSTKRAKALKALEED